jgi:hypothetical protein
MVEEDADFELGEEEQQDEPDSEMESSEDDGVPPQLTLSEEQMASFSPNTRSNLTAMSEVADKARQNASVTGSLLKESKAAHRTSEQASSRPQAQYDKLT